ncbi:hypothetical protein [Streptomyces fulvorobeus]|uniref:Uncharacterized protein n=1 Tax=Streptomyces fulvorobeus TaxID=284028 RepID=A0A7J0CBA9_9ACTN|nr:hypothetical protein [Streptomyces fulvorobeus]NYE42757.1 hypothetical protein [Streptomyces fulvorobeus]GFM99173.1 hypothetical protein Sfulv_39840 [Streptomyces fulvorobeus]
MTLTRGARITGALLCCVLAVLVAGWVVRDLRAVGEPLALLRHWAGHADARQDAPPATSRSDPVLFVVYVLAAVAALRSPVAASALVATGLVTLLLRLPGVWTAGATWMDGRYADELRTRALIATFVALAAALALLVTGAAGRRQSEDPDEPGPPRPGQGACAVAFLMLGAAGAVMTAWEIRRLLTFPAGFRTDWFIGGPDVRTALTDAPPGWTNVTTAVLCLVVAVSALVHAVHSRTLGMIVAGFVATAGSTGIARALRHRLPEHFGELGTELQLTLLTWCFLAVAGAASLIALARRGFQDVPSGPRQGYGHPWTGAPGYGYPRAGAPGYGYPPGSASARGPGPGYGYPEGGGAPGPPPPSSPPPGW